MAYAASKIFKVDALVTSESDLNSNNVVLGAEITKEKVWCS